MNRQQILDNIEQIKNNQLSESKDYWATASQSAEGPSQAQPVDYYQMQENAAYEASQKPTAYGSPAQVGRIVDKMVDEFKQTNYNVSRNQYDHLLDVEAKDQAEYLRQDYMTGSALPMVESLVEVYGADAILNNKKALAKLDEVMITPNGAGDGFTEGYLKQMHKQQLGSQGSASDAEVVYGVSQVKNLADNDDIRGSVSLAKQLKEKIDNGQLSANSEDYNLLLQVSSYR